MKTALSIPDKKAQEEVKKYAFLGLVLNVVSLFIFSWLAIAAAGLGARALVLTYHKANQGRSDLLRLRSISVVAVIISILIVTINVLD